VSNVDEHIYFLRFLFDETSESGERCDEIADILSRFRAELAQRITEVAKANAKLNEVQLKWQRLYGEIDCRIEHGANSNGHLEAILKMMQKIETNIKETDND
jgi:hypothetical protein